MPSDFTFLAAGGADSIGQSCYRFKAGRTVVAVDYGGGVGAQLVGPQRFDRRIDHILVTHAHGDHVWGLPWALEADPGVRMHATKPTAQLTSHNLYDAIRVAEYERRPAPYNEKQVVRVNQRLHDNPIVPGERIQLGRDLFVTAVGAGHILGAVSYFLEYGDRTAFVTGDICLRDRGLIGAADDFRLPHCDLVVRDSTYAGVATTMSYQEAEGVLADLAVQATAQGGRLLTPVFAIDRQFQVARGLRNDPRLAGVPIYLIGGEEPTNIYMRNFRGEFTLDGIERLANPDSARYKHLLSAREPMIVVATSGMVNYGTPSYHWAKQVMREAKSAICFVGFQNPSSTGGRLLQFKGHPGETFRFPDGDRRTLHCRIEQVDMSAHMKEEEAIELEARLNPRLVVHVHGERRRILDYVAGQRGKGPARIAATVGQEIEI